MLNKILGIVLATNFLQVAFIHSFSDNTQFFVWNVYMLLQCFLLSVIIHQSINYKEQKTKALNFVVLIFATYNLIDFVAEWSVAQTELYNYTVVVFSVILFCGVLPFSALVICRSLMPTGSDYKEGDSYLVYKKPTNWSGLMGLAFQAPYGHCSLVCEGQHFHFKKGEIVEEKYVEKKDDLHIKIIAVKLEEARKLLGTEWSLNNNCFNVFKKFK